jgi:four helix bundle protein
VNENVRSCLEAFAEIADWLWEHTKYWDSRCVDLSKQITRSADSIGANIAEGFGREYPGSVAQFYRYARGSAYETLYWLDRAVSRKIVPFDEGVPRLQQLRDNLATLESLITALPKGKG